MRKSVTYLLAGITLFLVFVAFSYLVHKDIFTQIDFNSTVRLQDRIPRRFDDFFSTFSDIGSFEPVLILLLVILFIRRKIIAGLISFFLFGMFHIFELYGKFFVDHLPPPQFMLRTKHQVEFPQFHVRAEFSYPSGHSGRALFIAVVLLFWIWQMKKLRTDIKVILSIAISLYVFVMLISRVYLGEHWMTDVIGGALLGASFGIIAGAMFDYHLFKKKESQHA